MQVKVQIDTAEREYDLGKAAQLKYGTTPFRLILPFSTGNASVIAPPISTRTNCSHNIQPPVLACAGELAKLEADLSSAEEAMEKRTQEAGASNRMLRDTVTVDDISSIVAKWTVRFAHITSYYTQTHYL